MSPELRIFESGHDRPLDIAGIEADLCALWKEASDAGKEPAMRASRANLVVLSSRVDPASSENGLEALLPVIARVYPSRVLDVKVGAPCEGGALCASVSALCSLGGGARYLCCERISLDAAPGAEVHVPAAILALLLGELPLVIWLPGADVPLAASWFRTLLDSADRIVLDSSLLPAPSAAFRGLRHLTDSFRSIDIADFEWLRLAPYRRTIADAFEDAPAREASREGFDRVTFFEPPSEHPPGRVQSATQTVLSDEIPAEGSASAASLLLRWWIASRVPVRSFVWADPRSAKREPGVKSTRGTQDGKQDARLAHRPSAILFEGSAAGKPFELQVSAPPVFAPRPEDLARLIGGQPDNPMSLGPIPRSSR